MAAVGTHEVDKIPHLFWPPPPAPGKKYGLRRRLHLQIRMRDPASRYVIEAFGNWSSHNPSADLCGLRATGGWGLGTYIHAFNPIVDTTLYTIMIYANQSTLASRIREIPFGA